MLRQGHSLSDEQLSVARKVYKDVIAFLEALGEPQYRLFLLDLREDLRYLDRFHEARKEAAKATTDSERLHKVLQIQKGCKGSNGFGGVS